MRPLYIFDLDGTLADCRHRLHFIEGEKQDWDSFYKHCVNDTPIKPLIRVFDSLQTDNSDCWIFSGRSDAVHTVTLGWLWVNNIILERNEHLIMRPDGDYTPDDELKQRFLDSMLIEDRKRLVAVFDDRQRVVDMWRRNGITCFQVAPGNF